MVVVAILGLLAAVAVPAFLGYKRRAHSSEVALNLNNMFKLSSALFSSEFTGRGVGSSSVRSCVASPTSLTPANPGAVKQAFVENGGFLQLGFTIGDLVYYGYGIESVGIPNQLFCSSFQVENTVIYTFFAHGDLDADTLRSTFELAVGADSHGTLYHAAAVHIVDELE